MRCGPWEDASCLRHICGPVPCCLPGSMDTFDLLFLHARPRLRQPSHLETAPRNASMARHGKVDFCCLACRQWRGLLPLSQHEHDALTQPKLLQVSPCQDVCRSQREQLPQRQLCRSYNSSMTLRPGIWTRWSPRGLLGTPCRVAAPCTGCSGTDALAAAGPAAGAAAVGRGLCGTLSGRSCWLRQAAVLRRQVLLAPSRNSLK